MSWAERLIGHLADHHQFPFAHMVGRIDSELLVMKVTVGHICDAVKSTVPHEMWGEIVEKLDAAGAAPGGARRRHGLLR